MSTNVEVGLAPDSYSATGIDGVSFGGYRERESRERVIETGEFSLTLTLFRDRRDFHQPLVVPVDFQSQNPCRFVETRCFGPRVETLIEHLLEKDLHAIACC